MWFLLVSVAFAFDHGPLQNALNGHVDGAGFVDYGGIKAKGALDGYLASLETAAEPTDAKERMAFWINAYNAVTIDVMADAWPLTSILDLDGGKVWDTRQYTVAGKVVTLNEVQKQILGPMGDPRFHAALNCASRGCPPLARNIYTGPELDTQLDAASAKWVTRTGLRLDQTGGRVQFNQIFDWYGEDFGVTSDFDIPGVDGHLEGAANFAARYLPADKAAYLKAGEYQAGWLPYDWKVNSK